MQAQGWLSNKGAGHVRTRSAFVPRSMDLASRNGGVHVMGRSLSRLSSQISDLGSNGWLSCLFDGGRDILIVILEASLTIVNKEVLYV